MKVFCETTLLKISPKSFFSFSKFVHFLFEKDLFLKNFGSTNLPGSGAVRTGPIS
jgi:hypothetical protein